MMSSWNAVAVVPTLQYAAGKGCQGSHRDVQGALAEPQDRTGSASLQIPKAKARTIAQRGLRNDHHLPKVGNMV